MSSPEDGKGDFQGTTYQVWFVRSFFALVSRRRLDFKLPSSLFHFALLPTNEPDMR